MKKNKVLLHSCCAICAGHPIKKLQEEGFSPIVYFYNPNIQPIEEYNRRLEAQKKLCNELKCELIVDNIDNELYCEIMHEYENHAEKSERCDKCFELRLLKTALKAKDLQIANYTTTISVSPHKNFKKLQEIGNLFAQKFEINFLDYDFKKQNGFLNSNTIAKSLNLYRQNYCGCLVSKKDLKNRSKKWIAKKKITK